MATFDILVNGTFRGDLLGPVNTQTSGCFSVHELTIGALENDDIDLTFTPTPGGYINYILYLDTGSGYVSIPNTHNFTFPDAVVTIRVIMENNGVPNDALSITIDADNNTEATSDSKVVTRTSTGAIC